MRENIIEALQEIWTHKMRSFLTMLGVIIGIASLIAIVSTIKGTNDRIMENLVGKGNNNVEIKLMQGSAGGAIESLNAALSLSNELVDVEYRAMRLMIEAGDYDPALIPEITIGGIKSIIP